MTHPQSGTTACNKPWRCICTDRKHPDGRPFLVLIEKEGEEIAVAVRNFSEPVKSQWFQEPLQLVPQR